MSRKRKPATAADKAAPALGAKRLGWLGALVGVGVVAAAAIGMSSANTRAAPAPQSSVVPVNKALGKLATRAWQPGNFSRYALTLTSQLTTGASDDILMGIEIRGNWEWTVVSASGGGATVHAALRDVAVNVKTGQALHQPSLDKLKAELQQSTFINVDSTGQIQDVVFTQKSQGFSLRFLETLLETTELAQAAKPGDAWQLEEQDTTGRYVAEYARLPSGAYEKRKLRYLSVMSGGIEQPDWTATVKEARTEFSIEAGGLSHLASKEVVSTSVPGALGSGTAQTSVTLALLAREARPSTVTQLQSLRASASPAAALELPDDTSAADQAVVHGRTLDALLKDAAGFPAEQDTARHAWADARRALSALFRLSPEAVTQASERARTRPTERDAIASTLGDAGSAPAQSALAGLARDQKLALPLREAALNGLARAERPEPETLQTFASLLDTAELSDAAALGLGRAIRNLRALDPARARDATALLTTRLASATKPGQRNLYVGALGNAAEPTTVDLLLESTRASDSSERSAAITALQSIPGAVVDTALTQAALAGKTVNERKSALTALRARPASPQILKAVASLARDEKEQSIRLDAIRALVDILRTSPDARVELAWVAEHDPVESFKAIAQHALDQR